MLIGAAQSITLNELSNLLAVSSDAEDYDCRRIPSTQVIKDLCSPLMVFQAPKDGDASDNPLVALCHKTVEDFFTQNPDEISPDTGYQADLRQYFVTPHLADARLGLDCLAYLQYARYQKPDVDLGTILSRPVAPEHAFLPYAATFWWLHLSMIHPTPKVNAAVQAFLRSPAFWNCLSAQAHVSPYLFGRYSSCRDRRYFKMGVKIRAQCEEARVGLPLPDWLDSSEEGKCLDRSLCSFAEEWREVLLTYPHGLDSCPPLVQSEPSCYLTPLNLVKTVKVARLGENLPTVCPAQRQVLHDVSFRGKTLWATMICFRPGGSLEKRQVPLFSSKSPQSEELGLLVDTTESSTWTPSVVHVDGQKNTSQAWSVHPSTLTLRRIMLDCSTEHKTPLAFAKEHMGRRKGSWTVASVQDVPSRGVTRGALQVIHMAWVAEKAATRLPRTETESNDDDDSGEDAASDAAGPSHDEPESDDDSDNDSSSSGAAENDPTPETSDTDSDEFESAGDGLPTDCLIVAPVGGKPSWYPWSSSRRVWSKISCAIHPILPLLVVSYAARAIEVINVITLTKETKHLPELADLDEAPQASLRGM